ncbi:MAG: ribonuclease HIII [Candidatus Syntrophosphaera sp.]|nr:ribonuclease HIII [Candidatus Syntrophosphaera sp.]
MDKHIEEYLAELLPELARRGIHISSQREIAYGVQLRLARDSQAATLNVYHSAKKGLSKVLGADSGSSLKQELEELCGGREQPVGDFHTWERWIGSDECGKGDYFGALVVAAFAMDSELEGALRRLGVADSKKLRDPQIKSIALQLYEKFNSRIACVVIKPLKYNEIIADMQSRKQNLNDLLAWQHGTAIIELLGRFGDSQGVLVDQFSRRKKVREFIKSRELPIPVEERPGAEADPAVAAASIIARYQFIQSRQAMDRHYQMKFPLGSGKNVLAPAREFADKYGWNRLAEVAKLHFVTSRDVRVQDIFEPGANK